MAGVGVEEELAGKDDLILALNSGSSSLKFGIFYRDVAEEEPLLTGSAKGIGHMYGSLTHSLFRRKTTATARMYPRVPK
jgi:acetate kinase